MKRRSENKSYCSTGLPKVESYVETRMFGNPALCDLPERIWDCGIGVLFGKRPCVVWCKSCLVMWIVVIVCGSLNLEQGIYLETLTDLKLFQSKETGWEALGRIWSWNFKRPPRNRSSAYLVSNIDLYLLEPEQSSSFLREENARNRRTNIDTGILISWLRTRLIARIIGA